MENRLDEVAGLVTADHSEEPELTHEGCRARYHQCLLDAAAIAYIQYLDNVPLEGAGVG